MLDDTALAALVESARGGDVDAVNAVVAALRPGIFRYALARLSPRELAEDVTQEACLGLAQALPRFEDRGQTVAALAYRIAHHKVVDRYRAGAGAGAEVLGGVPETVVDPVPGPAEVLERRERISHTRALLHELPERQRDILLLRVAAGLSAEEVAEMLDMTPGAVRVAQHRGLLRLRELAAKARAEDPTTGEIPLQPRSGVAATPRRRSRGWSPRTLSFAAR